MKKVVLLASLFCLTIGLNAQILITEIHYNPCVAQGVDTDYEFIEIFNGYSNTIDLGNWSFGGITYTFPAATMIASGEYIIITVNAANYVAGMNGLPAATQVFQWTSGGASNGGETITLFDQCGDVVDAVAYDDGGGWPTDADGDCASLQFTAAITDDNNDLLNWAATIDINPPLYGSTPGAGTQTAGTASYTPAVCVTNCDPSADLIFTEIFYNACAATGSDNDYEYVEIYNNGATAVNLEDYIFADAAGTYALPAGASIAAGAYIVLAQNAATFDAMAGLVLGTNLFDWGTLGLNNSTETITLTDCQGNIIDMVTYNTAAGSWGTCANGNDCVSLALPLDNYTTDNNDPTNWGTDGRGIGPSGALFAGVGSPGAANLATADAGYTFCAEGISVSPKVFLQGPLSGTTMSTALATGGLIPMMDPYFGITFTTIPTNAVDYVLVELRDDTTTPGIPDVIVASRIGFVLDDGTVVDASDGVSAVQFPSASAGDYYIAIKHRNHLSVVTGTKFTLN